MQHYRPRIPFSDFFPKLEEMKVGTVFHTIRFIDKKDYYFELADQRAEVDIWMSTARKRIATAEIIGVAVSTIEVIDEKMARADTYKHWDLNKLFGLLERFYKNKPEWKGWRSEVLVIFLLPTSVEILVDPATVTLGLYG